MSMDTTYNAPSSLHIFSAYLWDFLDEFAKEDKIACCRAALLRCAIV